MLALPVIGQHLDHPAFRDFAMGASLHHALKFRLERRQAGNAVFDLDQARAGDGIRRRTGLIRLVLQSE